MVNDRVVEDENETSKKFNERGESRNLEWNLGIDRYEFTASGDEIGGFVADAFESR